MQFEPSGGGGVSGLYEDEISKRLLQLEVASGGGSGGEGGVAIAGGLGRRMSEDSLLSLASLDRSLTKSLSQQQRQQQQQKQPYGGSPQDMLDSYKVQFPVKAGLHGKGIGGSEWVGGPPLVMTRKGKGLFKGSSLESASGSTQGIGVGGGSGLVVGGKTSKASGQGKLLTTSSSLASLQKQYFGGGGR